MHEVPVNCLVKLAQEKVWLGEHECLDMTIAVNWDVKHQTKHQQYKFSTLRLAPLLHNKCKKLVFHVFKVSKMDFIVKMIKMYEKVIKRGDCSPYFFIHYKAEPYYF